MKKIEKKCEHIVDLTSIEGDGAFPCPSCGASISPDDETEENYEIMDTKVVNDELAELGITCGKCRCTMRLTGFQQNPDA